jgi:Holliday junction DNA helicase RuvA
VTNDKTLFPELWSPPPPLITRITGQLVSLHDNDATLAVGEFEYQVLVPEFVRRQLQPRLEQTVSLRTIQYIEGNPQKGGRMAPRLVGFLHEAEREFFDLICQVDGVGAKKALAAMVRPVREVAEAIEEQDVKLLSALPGIGPSLAERIIAKLRRKMARFALLIEADVPTEEATARGVLNDAYDALVALGHSGPDARAKIEQVCEGGRKYKSVDDLLREVYQQNRGR